MAPNDFLVLATLAAAILLATPFLGRYIHRVMEGERVFLSPIVRPVERTIYRLCGIDETTEQGWKGYAVSVLVMAFVAIAAGYLVFRLQDVLPLNQASIPAMSPDLAFNTSVSFETNTNWQNYSGETGATYLTQAAVLAVRNFTSAATGLAIAIALFRGLTRRSSTTIGNYWVDLTRGVLYILLPIALVGALVLVWQGVPQTWNAPQTVTTLEGAQQTIAYGPIASQEWIKELGNNGGGFLNANSAHPFENPTPLTNWLEMFAILLVPFSLTYAFGRYAGNQRQGWTIFAAMATVLLVGAIVAMNHEYHGNPLFPTTVDQAGLGNMEGKEVRFGSALGGLFGAVTTGTSTGAINSWHDSFQPVAGLVPLFNIELGEITPGGIGAGMYGMLVIGAILAVFIAGLMVGRTPEYLGKKVEAFEIKMAMLVALVLGASILGFTAIASVLPEGTAGPLNPGPHGFSEILYAFSSQTGNNGSAFAGLTGNTPFYNVTGAFAMLIGRYGMIVPILALAGSMALKRRVAPSLGTFPTTGRAMGRPPPRCRDHRRRPDLLPGPGAGPDRRTAPPERREGLLMALLSVDLGRGTRRFQRFVTLGGAKPSGGEPPKPRGVLDPDLLRSAIPHAFRKLDPRLLIKNPVMFVVEITAVLVTLTAIADAAGAQRRAPAAWSSRSRSGSGCGSPSCSPPTPRRSPRHAVAPRRRPCARRARRRPPTAASRTARSRASDRRSCARATSSSSRRARRSPVTVTSSRASGSSTRPRSPASPHRSSRSRAPTSAARSPAARPWSATASWSW